MSGETAVVVCAWPDCEATVLEAGGVFGRGKYCADHLDQKRREGQERRKAEGSTPRRPRRTSTDDADDRAPRARKPRSTLAPRLESLLGMVGIAVFAVNPIDGQAILTGAPELAAALDQLARENPAVKRVLEQLLATSAWGAVAMATAKILLPIAANHELLPGMGARAEFETVPPTSPTSPESSAQAQDVYPFATEPAANGAEPEPGTGGESDSG
jgi:hypothetical protein